MAMIAITTSSSIRVNPFRRTPPLRPNEPNRPSVIMFITLRVSCTLPQVADPDRTLDFRPASARTSRATRVRSVNQGQIHIARVVENATAVAAAHQLFLALARNEQLRWQLHVTSATDAVLHADHHILSFAPHRPVVAAARAFVPRRSQFLAVGLQLGQFLLQVLFPPAELRDLLVHEGACVLGGLRGPEDFLLRRLRLLHKLDFPVLDLEDRRLAGIDFVRQRAVFLVLSRLELLIAVADNHLLLALDFQFQVFPGGFDLLDAELGILKFGLGGSCLGLERLTLRLDAGQLPLLLPDSSVPVLQDQQFFNHFMHSSNSNYAAGYPPPRLKSTYGDRKSTRLNSSHRCIYYA